jgi:hypothetical protein
VKSFQKLVCLALLLVLVVGVGGCSQIHSSVDGFLGKPMNEAATGGDIPAWYHVGQALNPFVHAVIAILRSTAIPALGL